MAIVAYIDGGARGNPGPAGYGVRVENEHGTLINEFSGFLGSATNNVAEYEGLLAAAQWLQDEGIEEKLVAKGDSQLVIKQMTGVRKINSATSKKYVPQIKKLLEGKDVTFSWVPREENEEADHLSRMAYEKYQKDKRRYSRS